MKKWTSGITRPTPWTFLCKFCGKVAPITKRTDGPGFYCHHCHTYTVA